MQQIIVLGGIDPVGIQTGTHLKNILQRAVNTSTIQHIVEEGH